MLGVFQRKVYIVMYLGCHEVFAPSPQIPKCAPLLKVLEINKLPWELNSECMVEQEQGLINMEVLEVAFEAYS